jgi:GT2 family glycosyltransferase
LDECIESIFNTKTIDFELILVDNDSTDNSQNICKEKFPEIILIQNSKNHGMSARNMGVDIARGDYIVFLDSDTVVTPNWLDNFIKSYEKYGSGLYGPKFFKKGKSDVFESTGNMTNIFGLGYARAKGEVDSGKYNEFMRISYPAGACVFSSRETIKKIGLVDDIFFAYHDDVDYGWRASLLNIPSFYEPSVTIYHLSSPVLGWSKKKYFLLERNRWICLLSLYSRSTLIKLLPFLFLVEIGIFFYMLNKGMGPTKIKSFFSLLRLSSKIKQKYLITQKQRICSDKEVIENFVDEFSLPTFSTDKQTSTFISFFIYKLSSIARKVV